MEERGREEENGIPNNFELELDFSDLSDNITLLIDNIAVNVLDWGSNDVLSIALENKVFGHFFGGDNRTWSFLYGYAPVKNMWCVFGSDTNLHVKCDITLNQPNGSIVTSIVRSVAENQVTARRLIVLVKEFAKCQNINSASKGTLSMMRKGSRKLGKYQASTLNFEPTPSPLLSDLLYSFFRFYTQDFDFKVHAVSLSHAGLVRKADFGWPHTDLEGNVFLENQVVILNPYGTENMSQSVNVDGIQRIEGAFKAAREILLDGRAKGIFHKLPEQ
ncbi:hypothetical protein OROGR_022278 [Orobanche gracilis]